MTKARILADYVAGGTTAAEFDYMDGVTSNVQTQLDAIASVPSSLVANRASGESTPTGWSEYTPCRGRMIVGLPSGGADAGTVGTAYTTAEDKSKSIAHTHTGPSHSHLQGFGWISEYAWNTTFTHGTGAIFTFNRYLPTANTSSYPATDTPNIKTKVDGTGNTSGMSANATVATSDILAYVQLMAIKKD